MAALEVQGKIKFVDASITWPHPTDKGYFVSAVFVRTNNDKSYLIYCPRATTAISIDEETFDTYLINAEGWNPRLFKKLTLSQQLSSTGEDVLFYIIYLGKHEPKQIKKTEIEKMFGIKVVD